MNLPLRALLAAALLLGLTACGKSDPATEAAETRTIGVLEAPGVPGQLNGLRVQREDVKEALEAADRPYLDALVLFSLREADKLQATLQIGHFADDTKYDDEDFRSSLLLTVGGATAKEFHVGDAEVFLTTGDRQSIAIWFEEDHMYILSSRDDYTGARALLREALDVQP